MKKKVVVYKKLAPSLIAELESRFDVTAFDGVNDGNRAAFMAALAEAEGMVGASVKFDAAMLAKAGKLRIASTISVGFDTFDTAFLRQRGIVLTHTPGVLTETVADTVFALILATARRVVELAELVKAGRWERSIGPDLFGTDVHDKTIGFLGMGRIGAAVARRARLGFGMKVIYHDLHAAPSVEADFAAVRLPIERVLAEADFVCALLPLLPSTEKLVDAAAFARMKRSAFFINGSRGRVVDEAALIEALRAGTIAGAGLDVFEKEPLPAASPLLSMPNVVALPHIGSATHETRAAMAETAVADLIAGLEGRKPAHLVDESVWQARYADAGGMA
ncbi:2-hydroxyacid dehydrogenase [Pleomorphomonas carboxyditropha]|uniref:Glyoxylate/hydroxypyruvate reductase B n=1 Tax=Pleomorphomonas carboxyditropha TaxID=2023338 RepID=A0A2G9WQW4_9HYPH|nr:D-glycerate dehydrogenase [Pleomorphomonas carboxyditropha]PIO97107.1 bifunctional glyoxylate/hydroxypyruvate reductase B [Pleomorphomonas carboxyditropha]